jgi:hypothetical protein
MGYSGPTPLTGERVLKMMADGWAMISCTGLASLACKLEKGTERHYVGRGTFARLRNAGLVRYIPGAKNRIELTAAGRRAVSSGA